MAVAVASVATTAWTGCDHGIGITINKPTGLAVGDLMIAHIGMTDNANTTYTLALPSNWTALVSDSLGDGNASVAARISYIVATPTEVAASDFTFTNDSGTGVLMAGAIYRITGQGDIVHVQSATDSEASTTSTPTFTNTVTPNFPDSLLLFLSTAVDSETSGSASAYAITTDNPTWTEQYDLFGDGDGYFGGGSNGDGLLSGASAVRSAVTATGNSSLTYVNFAYKSIGTLVVMPPVTNASVAGLSAQELISSVPGVTPTADANVTAPNPVILTVSANTVTPSSETSDWTTDSKSSSDTWTNDSKS